MKRILFILLPLLCFLACQKKAIHEPSTTKLISTAQKYFYDSVFQKGTPTRYRAAQPKKIIWNEARVDSFNGVQAVYVPLVYSGAMVETSSLAGNVRFHLNYLTRLVIYCGSDSAFHARVITSLPDSNYFKNPNGNFTGINLIEDWLGNPIGKYLYTSDGKVKSYQQKTIQVNEVEVTETCYSIEGYNYSGGDPDDGYYWSEDAGCEVNYIGGESAGGGSSSSSGSAGGPGGGSTSPIITPVIPVFSIAPPNNIISSLPAYFSCFTNVGGTDHSYKVSVCVDEPEPGSRTPWDVQDASGSSANNNPVNTGHAFLILTESYGTTVITRNVGFYPATKVSPLSQTAETAVGVYNNDQAHEYNISGTMNLTNAQFFQILNYCEDNSAMNYNLNTNNCTTFVLNAVAQAGINLPRTIGSWPGGSGDDPGDLGEDMRTGNIPGMTVNTSPASNHMNVGICYP